MRIFVEMTEQVTYTTEYTVEEFAALVDCDPTEEAVQAVLDAQDAHGGLDSDHGIRDATGLLDDILDCFDRCEEREWDIQVVD